MENNWFDNKWAALTPFIMIVILNALYVSFASGFIYCRWGNAGCKPINVENILPKDKNNQIQLNHIDLNDSSTPNRNVIATRYNGRTSWVFLMAVYMFLSVISFVVSILLTRKSFADWGKPPVIGIVILMALSTLLGLTLHYFKDLYMPVLKGLLEKTIVVDVTNIVQVANTINSIGFAASFSLVLASCAVLLPTSGQGLDRLKKLSTRMNDLRAILYTGTLMLVAGVLLMRSLFNWSIAFIPQTAQDIEVADIFNSGILSAEAGFYTLILAAVYLPAAFILQERAHSITVGSNEEAEKDRILTGASLTFSFTESLPRILAILAPLLAGPVGELFGRLPN